MEIISIKNTEDSDMHRILEIRNLKEVRIQMINQELITIEDHKKWWSSKKEKDSSEEEIFILRKNNLTIGMFRYWFDEKFKAGNWGMFRDIRINDPISGIFIEYFAIEYFFASKLNKNNKLIAQVKKGNNIKKLHTKIGFVEENENSNWILMKLTKSKFDNCKKRFQKILSNNNLIK